MLIAMLMLSGMGIAEDLPDAQGAVCEGAADALTIEPVDDEVPLSDEVCFGDFDDEASEPDEDGQTGECAVETPITEAAEEACDSAAIDAGEAAEVSAQAPAEKSPDASETPEVVTENVETAEKMVACSRCRGSGRCRFCAGSGYNLLSSGKCPICHGSGQCTWCWGFGHVPENSVAGVKSGSSSGGSTSNASAVPKNTKITLNVGNTYQIDLHGNTGKQFRSSKRRVASVSAGGVITAKSAGKAKISFKVGKKKCTVRVTVKDPTIPTSVSLNMAGSVTWFMQDPLQLAASLPAGTSSGIRWKSSNRRVATVKNGRVQFKKPGRVTITVTTVRGKKKAKVKFIVKDGSKASAIAIVPPSNTTLRVGESITLTAQASIERPRNAGNPTYDPKARWKSSNGKVISVNKRTGRITAKKPGSSIITVTSGSKKKSRIRINVVK